MSSCSLETFQDSAIWVQSFKQIREWTKISISATVLVVLTEVFMIFLNMLVQMAGRYLQIFYDPYIPVFFSHLTL